MLKGIKVYTYVDLNQLKTARKRLGELENEAVAKDQKLARLEQSLRALKDDPGWRKDAQSQVGAVVSDKEPLIRELRKSLETSRRHQLALQEEIRKLKISNAQLQAQLRDYKQRIRAIWSKQKTAAEAQIDSKQNTSSPAAADLDELKAARQRLDELESEAAAKDQMLVQLEQRTGALEEDLRQQKDVQSRLSAHVSAKESLIQELQLSLKTSKSHQLALQEEIQKLKSENSQLQAQLANLKQQTRAAEAQIAQQQSKLETVESAEKEYGHMLWDISKQPEEGAAPSPCLQAVGPETDDYMDCFESLKANLLAYHRDESIKTILFLGTTPGDGSTTTAVNFAATLAQNSRLNILLIEANFRKPSRQAVFPVEADHPQPNFSTDRNLAAPRLKKVGPDNLYVVTPGSKLDRPASLFESQRFWEFLQRMRTEFDYVILDGPPLPSFPESKVICSKVDGVVMVIDSGKTRKEVALRAKKDIVEAGGKVLGVVLNKRKYHIPKWLYKHL